MDYDNGDKWRVSIDSKVFAYDRGFVTANIHGGDRTSASRYYSVLTDDDGSSYLTPIVQMSFVDGRHRSAALPDLLEH